MAKDQRNYLFITNWNKKKQLFNLIYTKAVLTVWFYQNQLLLLNKNQTALEFCTIFSVYCKFISFWVHQRMDVVRLKVELSSLMDCIEALF